MAKKDKYLHGFELKEQQRLLAQASFLEPYIFAGVDLELSNDLLEVGCGVGAQTKIMCRRFPELRVRGIDFSEAQLAMAKSHLAPEIASGQVSLELQDAQKLNLKKKNFDAAFVCWFLEHVPDPLMVLKRTREHLKPGAKIYCTEVFNQTFFVYPYSPALAKYWFEFNDYQNEIKGHPFIGVQLGNLLVQAGFTDIQTSLKEFHFDARSAAKRADFVEYFHNILLSTEEVLLEKKRVTRADVKRMKEEIEIVKATKDSVFFYAPCFATRALREVLMPAKAVIDFWFFEINKELWFRKDREFDERIRSQFADLHAQASRCELSDWRKTADGRLAEILVLDQFSRNLYRDDARAFAQDPLALGLAQEAVDQGIDHLIPTEQRAFLYMPYMHSESWVIHEQAIRLFSQVGLEQNLRFEVRHCEIIKRFGRFPHRNRVLGRISTPEEVEFLKTPGSSF